VGEHHPDTNANPDTNTESQSFFHSCSEPERVRFVERFGFACFITGRLAFTLGAHIADCVCVSDICVPDPVAERNSECHTQRVSNCERFREVDEISFSLAKPLSGKKTEAKPSETALWRAIRSHYSTG